jgi:hypothetical protein
LLLLPSLFLLHLGAHPERGVKMTTKNHPLTAFSDIKTQILLRIRQITKREVPGAVSNVSFPLIASHTNINIKYKFITT